MVISLRRSLHSVLPRLKFEVFVGTDSWTFNRFSYKSTCSWCNRLHRLKSTNYWYKNWIYKCFLKALITSSAQLFWFNRLYWFWLFVIFSLEPRADHDIYGRISTFFKISFKQSQLMIRMIVLIREMVMLREDKAGAKWG